MASIDIKHAHLKTLIIDTISLMLKNGISYEKQFKMDGVVGVTIDDNSALIVKLEQLVESDRVRKEREADEQRKKDIENLKREEEIEQIVEERTKERVRKRQADLSKIGIPQKRMRTDGALKNEPTGYADDDDNQSVTSGTMALGPEGDDADADIKVESDGVSASMVAFSQVLQ